MQNNPADSLKDRVMWTHLISGGQRANPEALETLGGKAKEKARTGKPAYADAWAFVGEVMCLLLDPRWEQIKEIIPGAQGLENRGRELITLMTQKTAGQIRGGKIEGLPFDLVDMTRWALECEAWEILESPEWARAKEILKDDD